MEDNVVLRSEGLDGFSFAAFFDGHAGFSSVEFLRLLMDLFVVTSLHLAFLETCDLRQKNDIQFKGEFATSSRDIYQADLGSDVEFILPVSDGLWDYMKSSDAVTFVRNRLGRHGDLQAQGYPVLTTAILAAGPTIAR